MSHWIFNEVRKFLDNSSRENQNKYCWINRFLQESNLYEIIMKNMSETCDEWSNVIWHKEDSVFQCCHKNVAQSSVMLTMAYISAIQKRTPCCFSITALLILAILYNEKIIKNSKLAWQHKQWKQQTISMNWFHISKVGILYFLWVGGLHVRGSDAYPVASLILVIITFSWCTFFSQTGHWWLKHQHSYLLLLLVCMWKREYV